MKFLIKIIALSMTGVLYGMSSQGGPQFLMGLDHGYKGWANPCGTYSSGISYMQCNAGYAQGVRSRPLPVPVVAVAQAVVPAVPSTIAVPAPVTPPFGIPQPIPVTAAYENQVGTYTGLPVLRPTQ